MADWRKVAIAAFLADGGIDESELKVIKKELYLYGKINEKELDFLIDLRAAAQKKARGTPLSVQFENLFFKAVQDEGARHVADGHQVEVSGQRLGLVKKITQLLVLDAVLSIHLLDQQFAVAVDVQACGAQGTRPL